MAMRAGLNEPMKYIRLLLPLIGALSLASGPARAERARVEAVRTEAQGGDSWRFFVTLSHPDSGWEHYADGWEVLDADGKVLGYRELVHPHVNEQPFTRSLGGVVIPAGTRKVFVRAHCLIDGWNGQLFRVELAN